MESKIEGRQKAGRFDWIRETLREVRELVRQRTREKTQMALALRSDERVIRSEPVHIEDGISVSQIDADALSLGGRVFSRDELLVP